MTTELDVSLLLAGANCFIAAAIIFTSGFMLANSSSMLSMVDWSVSDSSSRGVPCGAGSG